MTTTATTPSASTPRFRINGHDRVSLILTVALTVVALIAGLVLRNTVESRTKTYKSPFGVVIQYPDSWRLNTTDAASGFVHAHESNAQSFPTALELRSITVDPAAKDEDALALAASQVALNRGLDLTAFKVFDVSTGHTFKGLPGATASFVYVSDQNNPLQEGLPMVVLGDDSLVRKGGTVYVFSVLSTEENHAQALAQLKAFVDSAQLP